MQMKALVVDESPAMRSVLRRLFWMRGFTVDEASNGTEALTLVRDQGAVDVVLVDWNPDALDDLEFIARMRDQPCSDTIVIMMVTEEPEVRAMQRALIAGANGYLLKPFNAMQIDEKLATAGLMFSQAHC
jgi:two-component system chemotaxis response regulator CheY